MSLVALLRSIAARIFYRSQFAAEAAEELRSHIEHRADDLVRSGLPRPVADRRARIEFGGHARFEEECREALGGNFLETLLLDVRFSLRVLRKSPAFTIAAVITLAVAIGANAVVFGVLNALILRPLNVPHAQSFYGIEWPGQRSGFQSYPDYLDLRDRNRSFDSLAAFSIAFAGLDTGDHPSSVWTIEASGNYFDALRLKPYLGRFFRASDEHGSGSAPYVVLTYAYWRSHFHQDPGTIGRTVRLNKYPFTIIGVAPPAFHGTILFFFPDIFVPMVNQQQIDGANFLSTRGTRRVFEAIGHLKAGVGPAQAIADLNSIGSYLAKTYPKDDDRIAFTLVRPGLYGNALGTPVRAFLTALMLLTALILLAACANLGSLFAARAAARSREFALRLALGASRTRLLRHLFTEAVLISLAGGAAGKWSSVLLLDSLSAWQPVSRFPFSMAVTPDARVYAAALLLTLASGFFFGAVPIRQILRTDPCQIVKSGSAKIARRITVRDLLLAAQIAICALLVTASLVALRGLSRSLNGNFGFEPRNTLLATTVLDMGGYRGEQIPAMQKRMIGAIETIPAVESVGLADTIPLADRANTSLVFSDRATDLRPSSAAAETTVRSISPQFLTAARVTLLVGRSFTWSDDKNTPRVAIGNRQLARKLFGSPVNAIGRYFKLPDGSRIQVVGVVEDGKFESLTANPEPALFLPMLQSPSGSASLVVRSNMDQEPLARAIRARLRHLDPALPCFIEPWYQAMDTNLFPARMATLSLGVLGAIGTLLSITGIFGLAASSVGKRLKELGIRMALGAQHKEVLAAALGRAFRLLAFGSAAGLVLGILASRVLASIVYQATPRDPLILTAAVFAMALVGLLATWVPAQRALALDPLTLLRDE